VGYPSPPPERTLAARAAKKRYAAARAEDRAAKFRAEAAELERLRDEHRRRFDAERRERSA
jgi:hypothetical protein